MNRWTKHRTAAIFFAIALAVSVGLSVGCASDVPPTVTLHPVAPIKKSEPIFVIAPREHGAVIDSLKKVGLNLTDRPDGYVLRANVGGSRGSGTCGSVRNVGYILTIANARVMVIKGRGGTGDCSPNIFDQMSEKLAAAAS